MSGHWARNCEYPEIPSDIIEELTGLLMGDGSINRSSKNPYMEIKMINREFLDWYRDRLGIFGTDVFRGRDASEIAKANRESGFSPDAKKEDYHDAFRLRTRTHPQLQELADWYDSGEKVWPDNIDLTPTVLKYWYCSDGALSIKGHGGSYMTLSLLNEIDNKDKVDRMFSRSNIQYSKWITQDREGNSSHRGRSCRINFNQEQTEELLDYMGDPLPGFEYKWALKDVDKFDDLKDRAYGDGEYEGRYDDENWAN